MCALRRACRHSIRQKNEIARGLVAYSSDDLRRIAGRRSDEIHGILGFHNGDVAVHRDDLVLVDQLAQDTELDGA